LSSGWSDVRRPGLRRVGWVRAGVLLWLMVHGFSAAAQEPRAGAGQTIRVAVERVNVGVIVSDAQGKFVEGLKREDFRVFDNGAAQPVTDFASIDAPGQVLMLVEAGPAVYLLQDTHLFVADSLLNGLSPGDRVAIACYNDAAAALLDFTTDKDAAEAALERIQFNLGYGDLNLAKSLSTVQDWLARAPGKKTIVLLSTGVDTSTPGEMQSLVGRLQTGDVRILPISMSGPLRNGKHGSKQQLQEMQQTFAQADAWLKALADATGGRAFFPGNAKEFQETYRQVAEIVRHEYSLAFAPPASDGGVHLIDVKAGSSSDSAKNKAPEYRVDHRKAYVAPKAAE
jgi:Ca-activated chloride channel family protein